MPFLKYLFKISILLYPEKKLYEEIRYTIKRFLDLPFQLDSRFWSWSQNQILVFCRQVHSAQQNDPKYKKSDYSDTHHKMKISPCSRFFFYRFIFTGIAERIIIQFRMGRAPRHSGYHGGVAIGISEGMLTYYSNGSHFSSDFGLIISIKSVIQMC